MGSSGECLAGKHAMSRLGVGVKCEFQYVPTLIASGSTRFCPPLVTNSA